MIYDIGIIGGGASGQAAAISAARLGASVLVLERLEKTGKKILATGNGRCNLTNMQVQKNATYQHFYRGSNPDLIRQIIDGFNAERIMEFFRSLGVLCYEKDGYVYPRSNQAATINDALKWAMAELHVDVVTECHAQNIQKTRDHFYQIKTTKGKYFCKKLILACGGMAQAKLGSDGSGYSLAGQMGHSKTKTVPALCGLKCEGTVYKMLTGIRTKAKIKLMINDQQVCEDTGELQLTSYGISGIPVFQLSRFAALGLQNKQRVIASINFMPDYHDDEIVKLIIAQKMAHPEYTMKMLLSGVMNKKLAEAILTLSKIPADIPCKKVSVGDIEHLVKNICDFDTKVIESNNFDQAQVTAGGISMNEIRYDLSSCKSDGLYIVGELLDVDGICGGFNLHWAWTTGIVAGESAAKALNI